MYFRPFRKQKKKAKNSLKILKKAYQFKYVRLEIKLIERSLPLLKKLEEELVQELPDYKNIGALEEEAIKLLISFQKKSTEIVHTIERHEKLFQLYQGKN